jgi:hypothetical protein
MGILKSDLGDEFAVEGREGRVDERGKVDPSKAGLGVDVEENGEGAGEMVGREAEAAMGPDSVIGNPKSFKISRALLKSPSFRNFS